MYTCTCTSTFYKYTSMLVPISYLELSEVIQTGSDQSQRESLQSIKVGMTKQVFWQGL